MAFRDCVFFDSLCMEPWVTPKIPSLLNPNQKKWAIARNEKVSLQMCIRILNYCRKKEVGYEKIWGTVVVCKISRCCYFCRRGRISKISFINHMLVIFLQAFRFTFSTLLHIQYTKNISWHTTTLRFLQIPRGEWNVVWLNDCLWKIRSLQTQYIILEHRHGTH